MQVEERVKDKYLHTFLSTCKLLGQSIRHCYKDEESKQPLFVSPSSVVYLRSSVLGVRFRKLIFSSKMIHFFNILPLDGQFVQILNIVLKTMIIGYILL